MDAPRRWPLALISELQRRQVIRVAVVYLLAAWIMSQVAETMFPNLGLDPWTVTLVMGLLLIGFPVAVALAWAFDITPYGVERTPDTPPATVRDPAEPRPIRTIVALPFANLSSNGDAQYISDGVTEELMAALARIPGLRVAARTSSFAFSNRGIDIREIGRQLGVDAAVEGSVRIVDTRVRIAVQLTDVQDGYQIWSQTFDRPLGDILALQEDIARSIVAVLRPGSVIAAGELVRPSTASAEAWTLYLQGRYFWNRRTPAGLRAAIERLQAATASDPQFALAHAGLADCYSIMLDHGAAAPRETLPLALAAARKAVALDDGLAEALAGAQPAAARDWLRRAAAEQSPQLAYANVDPLLDEVRSDAALRDIFCGRGRLPVGSQAHEPEPPLTHHL